MSKGEKKGTKLILLSAEGMEMLSVFVCRRSRRIVVEEAEKKGALGKCLLTLL